MPKAYKQHKTRYRSTFHTFRFRVSRIHRHLSEYPPLQLIIMAILAGLLLTGIFLSVRSFLVNTFSGPPAYSVVGPPTITATQINEVLAYYHSPAQNKGQALYDYGKDYDIDPAFALAFFMHESSFGTQGVAKTTHSLGNIRSTSGYANYDGYRSYKTWEEGFEDWYRLIAQQYVDKWGLSTVEQIIPVYAPSEDNNDEVSYIHSIEHAVDIWRTGSISI
jgi:Mannosyl-glycoprotein endo-beta-N-acetylglucosaminidase